MNPLIVGLLTVFFLAIASTFGGKLSARKSVMWFVIFLFLIFSASWPKGLQPMADIFSIQIASNFFFAVMIVFLLAQLLIESSTTTEIARKMRNAFSNLAVDQFLNHFFQMHNLPEKLKTRVLIVVPCYNEETTIVAIGTTIRNQFAALSQKEFEPYLILVNDCSNDQSQSLLNQNFLISSTHSVYPVHHLQNLGVTGVLSTGFKIALRIDADFVLQFDGDGQHPADQIEFLLCKAREQKIDLLIGSRYLHGRKGHADSTTPMRVLGSFMISTFLKMFRGTKITDPTSGLRVYSKNAYQKLLPVLPDEYPEPESLAIASNLRLKVVEVFVAMQSRQGGASSLQGFSSLIFMWKVSTALIGLRLRSFIWKFNRNQGY